MLGWEPPLEILAMLAWVQILMLYTCPSGGCIVEVSISGLQAVQDHTDHWEQNERLHTADFQDLTSFWSKLSSQLVHRGGGDLVVNRGQS